ncbi:hypothetical protein V5O48_006491 [Marasmius crinis-equi]|uniref:Uncharacterized protein n=1 Tax=Marasmius crinis-equi TaxID=585013 RepID=A0ABR3FJC6_9AGAR
MSSSYFRPKCLEHTELIEPPSIIVPSTGPQRNPRVHRPSSPPYFHPRNAASPRPSPALVIDSSDSSSEDDDDGPSLPCTRQNSLGPVRFIARQRVKTRPSPAPVPEIPSTSHASPSMDGSESEYSLNVPEDVPSSQTEDWDSLPKIAKPEGEAGRPKRGGYNLEEKLGWDDKLLSQVKSFVKGQVLASLTCSLPFTSQPADKLEEIRSAAIERFPLLRRYEDCWVVDDLVRCNLKYQKQKLVKEENQALAEKTRVREKARDERRALQEVATSSKKRSS